MIYTTTISADGQVTIPSAIRQQLNLQPERPINLEIHKGTLILTPVKGDIRAAFGLLKAKQSVSLADMDKAIEQAIIEQYVQPSLVTTLEHGNEKSWSATLLNFQGCADAPTFEQYREELVATVDDDPLQ